MGKKMKQLERRKFAAVEVEDYDTAKLCKVTRHFIYNFHLYWIMFFFDSRSH